MFAEGALPTGLPYYDFLQVSSMFNTAYPTTHHTPLQGYESMNKTLGAFLVPLAKLFGTQFTPETRTPNRLQVTIQQGLLSCKAFPNKKCCFLKNFFQRLRRQSKRIRSEGAGCLLSVGSWHTGAARSIRAQNSTTHSFRRAQSHKFFISKALHQRTPACRTVVRNYRVCYAEEFNRRGRVPYKSQVPLAIDC